MNATSCGSRWLSSQSIRLTTTACSACRRAALGAAPEAAAAAAVGAVGTGDGAHLDVDADGVAEAGADELDDLGGLGGGEEAGAPLLRQPREDVLSVASSPCRAGGRSSSTSSSRPRHSSDGRRSMTSSTRPGVPTTTWPPCSPRTPPSSVPPTIGASRSPAPAPRRRGATPPCAPAPRARASADHERADLVRAQRVLAPPQRLRHEERVFPDPVHACTATSWWRSSRGIVASCPASPSECVRVGLPGWWRRAPAARGEGDGGGELVVLEPSTRRARRRGGRPWPLPSFASWALVAPWRPVPAPAPRRFGWRGRRGTRRATRICAPWR